MALSEAVSLGAPPQNQAPRPQVVLPPLREDISLLPAPRRSDGSPAWSLYDPARQRYFRIGWLEFEILSRWQLADPEAIAAAIRQQTALRPDADQVQVLHNFLAANHLVQARDHSALLEQHRIAQRKNLFATLLQKYIFLKIPLWRPDAFLKAALPLTAPFFSAAFWQFLLVLGLAGLYFTGRQWESFQHSFLYFTSVHGMLYYAAALIFTKILHELGHAFAAKRFGVHIPSMGVVFILFWPILYTDTSDSWRLTRQRQRLVISGAGIMVELAVAILATLLWNFLPEGPLRGAVFLLASTTWLLTLAVNLNPFMRFDGYYLLADLLDIANLQPRAFALGRWWMRRTFLGIEAPCPENLPKSKIRLLLLYAYGTWLYRFFLFLGIALLIYAMAFKVLGIFLMAAEIVVLIAFPICREMGVWWRARQQAGFNLRLALSLGVLLGGVLFCFTPLPVIIEIPAIFGSASSTDVYPPVSGRIDLIMVKDGQKVSAGQPLFSVHSARLDFSITESEAESEIYRLQLDKLAYMAEEADRMPVVEKQLTQSLTALQGFRRQKEKLLVRAPISGTVDLHEGLLHLGAWLGENRRLMSIIDTGSLEVEGYVHEDDYHLISTATQGRFYPEAPESEPFQVLVQEVLSTDIEELKAPYLASTHGGPIPVRQQEDGRLLTNEGYYTILMTPQTKQPAVTHVMRGTVRIRSQPASLIQRSWPRIAAVVIRESGF